MQTVSESWKNAHKQTLLNESFVEVSLTIADPEAMADATSSDNGAAYLSNTPEVVSEVSTPVIPYATLEQNIWLLDGTRKSIPESEYLDGGYVGEVLSNDECVFDKKIPVITIAFSRVHTQPVPGITITWGTAYNEYADSFIVTAYDGDGAIVAQKEVLGNKSVTSIVELNIANYKSITIQVMSWCLPHHRMRVDEMFVGWSKVYSKVNLMSYSHQQTVDPISTSLPKMEIKFSIDNSDNSYNPLNPEGLNKYLTTRQEVTTRYGLKMNDGTIEWIKGGTFYLSEWYAKQNGISADFVARDLLEFMSTPYQDSTWTNENRSLYDIATNLLMAANLPLNSDGSFKWVIDDSLKGIYTTGKLPDDTIANGLQIVANMGCCVLYPDRNGLLHIEPIRNEGTDYVINSFNSYSKAELALSKSLKQVVVKVHQYTPTSNGVDDTITQVTVDVGETGEIITIDNPLITDSERAMIVGTWMGDYLKNRSTLKVVGRADVRLDALDIVSNENDYSTDKLRMTNVKFDFNGAFRGSGEGRVI